jgi:hypothetical protein
MPRAVQLLSPALFVADFPAVAHVAPNGQIFRRIGPAILQRKNMIDLRRYARDDAVTIGASVRVANQDRLP